MIHFKLINLSSVLLYYLQDSQCLSMSVSHSTSSQSQPSFVLPVHCFLFKSSGA